jgi:hypothetical protein
MSLTWRTSLRMLSETSNKHIMSNTRWLISLGLLCLLTLLSSESRAADKKVNMSKVPPAADKKGVTFDKDVKPLLEKSCLKCHSGDKPKSKYRMDTLASVIKGGESGDPAIVPGHSEKSPLVLFASDALEEMEMPPIDKRDKYPALTKEQIGLIRAWIDQGAK